jgi:hypothetical protein
MTVALDLLTQAIMRVRPRLDRAEPPGHRLRVLWAGVVAARKLGAADVVAEEFTALAVSSGLAADLARRSGARNAGTDIAHVVSWGLLNRDPFGRAK